jgi:hypothetical protein
VVRLFFPCEHAILEFDDDSGESRWVLTRPLHTAVLPAGAVGKFELEEIWFYAQLTGGIGTFRLSVTLSTEEGFLLGRSDSEMIRLSQDDPLTAQEFVFQMVNVLFPRAGVYEFRLLANHVELPGATAVFHVRSE